MRTGFSALVVPILAAGLLGCDATVELTKAPFDATTAISDGFTQATSEITQPTQEFTSSTTPGSWFGNNSAKTRQKVDVFAAYTYGNIQSDISRGDGEYLTSLATLAGVPSRRLADFRVQMKNQYADLYDSGIPLRESADRVAAVAWSAGYGRDGQSGRLSR